jgi:hypothetical protein
VVKDPVAQRETLRAWLGAFDRAAKELDRPGVVFYTYLKDEPNTLDDYRYVQKWGRAVRGAGSAVKVLVVEQFWTAPGMGGADSAWGDLYGAVDIWCPLFSLHRQDSAARRQALGETIWTYTDLRLTEIGLGTWAMGGGDWRFIWGPQDDEQSVRTIRRALDLGVNWIDTAAVYGLGHSEWLKRLPPRNP